MMFSCKCGRSPSELKTPTETRAILGYDDARSTWLCPCGKGYVDDDHRVQRSYDVARAIERWARAHFDEMLPKLVRDVLESLEN